MEVPNVVRGLPLAAWLRRQKRAALDGELDDDKLAKLAALGVRRAARETGRSRGERRVRTVAVSAAETAELLGEVGPGPRPRPRA